tara:strand:- start:189 stop:707 length:519 start_codon:yes stop_codon:yes gene_type:complete
MAWGYPYKRKLFGLMGGYLGDHGAGPMGSGNIEIPHLPPSHQRTPEQSVGGGLPTDRLNRYNRWLGIEKSPNLRKWGSMPSSPQYDYTMDASAGSPAKKKSNKLKYIVEALKEMEGAEPPELSGEEFGRAMPAPLGFSLASMGGRLGEQEAMAKARREEELRRRMKLMGGGY